MSSPIDPDSLAATLHHLHTFATLVAGAAANSTESAASRSAQRDTEATRVAAARLAARIGHLAGLCEGSVASGPPRLFPLGATIEDAIRATRNSSRFAVEASNPETVSADERLPDALATLFEALEALDASDAALTVRLDARSVSITGWTVSLGENVLRRIEAPFTSSPLELEHEEFSAIAIAWVKALIERHGSFSIASSSTGFRIAIVFR